MRQRERLLYLGLALVILVLLAGLPLRAAGPPSAQNHWDNLRQLASGVSAAGVGDALVGGIMPTGRWHDVHRAR